MVSRSVHGNRDRDPPDHDRDHDHDHDRDHETSGGSRAPEVFDLKGAALPDEHGAAVDANIARR